VCPSIRAGEWHSVALLLYDPSSSTLFSELDSELIVAGPIFERYTDVWLKPEDVLGVTQMDFYTATISNPNICFERLLPHHNFLTPTQ
jgi:hypothetical protein